VREVRHRQGHGGKEGKVEEVSVGIIFCFGVITFDIFILSGVVESQSLFTFCISFTVHLLYWCTVTCGNSGDTLCIIHFTNPVCVNVKFSSSDVVQEGRKQYMWLK
jgi:hypothetical protein